MKDELSNISFIMCIFSIKISTIQYLLYLIKLIKYFSSMIKKISTKKNIILLNIIEILLSESEKNILEKY